MFTRHLSLRIGTATKRTLSTFRSTWSTQIPRAAWTTATLNTVGRPAPQASCQSKFLSSSSSSDSPKVEEPKLLYKAPMGDLITRLKRISITSCMLSVVGLPFLIYLKNGTWPDAKQLGMGGFAFISATGSTLALHFVFGPYVLELYEMPNEKKSPSECIYKATTRSIFGLKSEILFDPLTDVTRYQGARPFANFVANGDHILYCHPERLDELARRRLLNPVTTEETPTATDSKDKELKEDKVRRPIDEQDGFL